MSADLYSVGSRYILVPVGLALGFILVFLHRVVVHVSLTFSGHVKRIADIIQFKPYIRGFDLRDINMPTLTVYSGLLGFQQTQTSPVASTIVAGLFVQYYLRNYRPRIFKDYSYLVTAALDGGSLLCIFILSFAVFGAAGSPRPFPTWWGNADGYPDHCPAKE